MKEQDNTSIARIKPPKQVSKPFYIKLEELEAFQEATEIRNQRSDH
ncbi:hypothetical protein HW132_28675 [Brasilonema sp. CT11]|nr:hypothetical protein [Brasilonema sp. CT11]